MARGFCANIDEYLLNPKYFRMYESGRGAVEAHITGSALDGVGDETIPVVDVEDVNLVMELEALSFALVKNEQDA